MRRTCGGPPERKENAMKNTDNWDLMMSAAKQYYQLGLSQDIIAKNLFISKSTVSRLIKKAVEMGYIEFRINSFGQADEMLQHELLATFGIHCTVLPTLLDSELVRLNDVCAYSAKDILQHHISDSHIIGIPWGKTIEYLAANINEPVEQHPDMKICMVNGFVNGSIRCMRGIHIVEKLSAALKATGYILPCPLLVESPEVKATLLSDSSVKEVFDIMLSADTLIMSVGPFDMHNTYLTELGQDVVDHLRGFNGAGNFAGRTFDINGRELPTGLGSRLMSLSIKEVAAKKKRICIAVGEYKARAILGLLRGHIINYLYTDSDTARAVLSEHKKQFGQSRKAVAEETE